MAALCSPRRSVALATVLVLLLLAVPPTRADGAPTVTISTRPVPCADRGTFAIALACASSMAPYGRCIDGRDVNTLLRTCPGPALVRRARALPPPTPVRTDVFTGVCLDCDNRELAGAEALTAAALLELSRRLHARACDRTMYARAPWSRMRAR